MTQRKMFSQFFSCHLIHFDSSSFFPKTDYVVLLFCLQGMLERREWTGCEEGRSDCHQHASPLTFTYPLTTGLLGHHRWPHNQFPPFFSVLHCPLGLGELQACPFPDVVLPPHFLSALFSSPFHCALQHGFGQTWWTGDYDGQIFV